MALFEIEHLNKTYHTGGVATPVLHDVSFSIEKGEFVSVMGPSGSGKSTLLQIMGFLSDLSSGEYRFNGRRFAEYDEDERAQVRNAEMGFIFQAFNLLPRQTIRENVMLPLMYSGRSPRGWNGRVEEVVESVGLEHRIDYETYKLSGGEKQRVAIARALVNNPDVIFADEPTGNLDSESGQAVMEEIQELYEKQNHTVILITHEARTAQYAERLIALRDGRIERDEKVTNQLRARDGFTK